MTMHWRSFDKVAVEMTPGATNGPFFPATQNRHDPVNAARQQTNATAALAQNAGMPDQILTKNRQPTQRAA
jgi:hypothetical protein